MQLSSVRKSDILSTLERKKRYPEEFLVTNKWHNETGIIL